MRHAALLFWLMVLGAGPVRAAAFHARLGLEGDLVQITYVLEEAKGQVGEPDFPEFKGLNLVSGPAVGTSYRIVNGVSSQEKTWSFSFLPESEQARKIGPARIRVNGALLTSESLTVPGRSEKQAAGERPLRLSFEVEPRRPVVGQAMRLRLRLDFSVNVRGYDQPALGSAPGFVVEALERPAQPEVSQRTVGGQTWNTAILGEWLLFPVREGSLHLPPVTLQVQVEEAQSRKRRDPFDFFGSSLFNRLKTLAVSTDPLNFSVAPLPAGAPVEFNGAVGSFTLRAAPDKTTLKAGEALTLTVTLEGAGNVAGLEAPTIRHSPDLERYDTQTESDFRPGPRGQTGRRVFKTLFVPRVPGEQRIEALAFAFFDPATGSFKRLSAGPWTLQVSPGDGSVNLPGAQGPGGQQVTSYGQDIRQLLPTPRELPLRQAPVHHRWPWLLGLALALAWVPGAALLARRRARLAELAPALRGRSALRRARTRLKAAGSQAALQEEILRSYLADRLGRAATGLLLEDCLRELALRGADAALKRELEETWRRLEFQRYGGGAGDSGPGLLTLLERLEAWFRAGEQPTPRPPRAARVLPGLLLLVILSASAGAATPEERFEAARQAYEVGDFPAAAQGWQALLDEGYGGLELVYNLGNAWYRCGDSGRAVLNWERALALQPLDRDARANLEIIRPSLADRFEAPVRLPIWDTLDGWLALLPTALLAWGGLLFALAAAGVAGVRYVQPERRLSPTLRLLFSVLLVPALLTLSLLALQDRRQVHSPRGVILPAKVEVRTAPSAGSTAQFDLHTGTVVRLARESAAGWREIVLPDGRSGWVPVGSLEAVHLSLPSRPGPRARGVGELDR
ncbi:MAG: BatD family protein [Candidatus Delongbacteria bacterium]